jgi:hypothetical protein
MNPDIDIDNYENLNPSNFTEYLNAIHPDAIKIAMKHGQGLQV